MPPRIARSALAIFAAAASFTGVNSASAQYTDAISRQVTVYLHAPTDDGAARDAVSRQVTINMLSVAMTDAISRVVTVLASPPDDLPFPDAISRVVTVIKSPPDDVPFHDAISRMIVLKCACLSDFNEDGGTDGADVDLFFSLWENGDAVADVNLDGGIDGEDVRVFFIQWEGGC